LMQDSESPEQTAKREVNEETGLQGMIKEKLGEIQYIFYSPEQHSKIRKTVHFFLMQYLQGSVEDHDSEVDEARWLSIKVAVDLLAYDSERDVLKKAIKALDLAI